MTTIEQELINAVRNHDKPYLAFLTAVSIIIDALKQHESSEEQSPVCPQEYD